MAKRKSYAKLEECYRLPNMLEIQLNSYEQFLQKDIPRSKRKNEGLESAFREVFPLETPDGEYRLDYISYTIGKTKYAIPECKKRGMSYAGALRVMLRLKSKKETKEQEVYLGDIPLMTETGTFIVNGDERVVVSQLHRSPGISFESEPHPSGKSIYSARIIPYRGAWVEFEFDMNDVLYVYVDRRRKFLATTLLRVFGHSTDESIVKTLCGIDVHEITRSAQLEKMAGLILAKDVAEHETNTVIAQKYEPITKEMAGRIWNSSVRKVETA
ncbi:MAG: DNA-directed RNA polymerase subunit beta, partial [Candidatus Omnitrophica bacterium]|nr:DNA-directed RNA polymerase subunit beta [Candidatus Omnitrophota bacterium]